ncbi:replication initiation and membrane attachment family protein [Metabacillus sp. RGM 3146]|uniref:replication initiation and membrane attachment family protein n=1 Tax=Metabacillus sp. RGM 3146 TaxID=3401092 RepID=UPI003B9CC89E
MDHHWKELIPPDRYITRSSGVLNDFDRKIITMLYQPLIGPNSLALYMTLWGELEQNRLWGKESSHHSLMAAMQCNLKEIYRLRIKLEGIGLLKTYLKEEQDFKVFIYELQAPLKPDLFFQDGMLNIYLYNKLGRKRYVSLKKFFCDESLPENLKDMTKSFNDVYQTLQPSELTSQLPEQNEEENSEYMTEAQGRRTLLDDSVFDFDLLFAGLSEAIIPKKAINDSVKETIKKLSYIYGMDAIQMKNILMNAILPDETIDEEELRKSARDWYKFEHGEQTPRLSEKIQPLPYRTVQKKETLTKEEELAFQLENISPYQFLRDIAEGGEPPLSDLQIIEDVMFQQKLYPGVVNVLIYYVMLKTDMKLSKGYVQKIAGHWARKNIKTVDEAMELAKKEQQQYMEWAEAKNKPAQRRKSVRKEMLPDWLKTEEGKEQESSTETNAKDDFELERQKLAERIKKYKNKNSQ